MNEDFIKLTNTVYKVLEFFPESDPLKNRAKDKALSIMEHLVLINEEPGGWLSFQKEKIKVQLLEDIDILLGYLWIGKSQGWLGSTNCLIIGNEYEKMKKEIGTPLELTIKLPGLENNFANKENAEPESVKAPDFLLSERQGQILEFLGKNEKAQVMDLQTVLPDITKRTIRRDLDELLEAGKIERSGDFNQVSYKIKRPLPEWGPVVDG